MNRLRSVAALSSLLAWTAPASATTVVIARPPNASREVAETLSRLHGELLSAGVEVPMVESRSNAAVAGTDWRAWLDQVAGERGADAVVDIIGDEAVVAVDVWVLKAHGRLEVTRVTADANAADRSGTLAIRAFEALRGSLLELDFRARGRRTEQSERVTVTAPAQSKPAKPAKLAKPAKPMSERQRWALELGATALMSLDGVGPALMPLARAGWAPRSWLTVQAALAGGGSRPSVTSAVGSTRVAQQYATLGGRYAFQPDAVWWPFVGIAAGTLHTTLDGRAGPTVDAHRVDQWSFALDGSCGAGLRVYGRYYLTLALHAQIAAPYVAIYFVDKLVATSGRPNLLLSVSLGAWL